MMDENQIMDKLKELLTEDRLKHSIGVRDTAVQLAKIYHCDMDKASVAGLLHDCAKDLKKQQLLQLCDNFDIVLNEIERSEIHLIHGPLGAKFAQCYFGINDPEILDAIYYHTVAKEKMTLLTKIVYLADFIEPNRDYPGVEEIRRIAYDDLNDGILAGIDATIRYVLKRGKVIHPNTINARNYILLYEK
ncbi:bis(5'-nucleosyl)-tetraphosphatase (symmetrical) YqeK [Petroclostridium sp. X23]|uniref:bis(5'-nucleosyl)-tetraphosphatase (symmetrical) YqeK n=1 Tax=Petroclostridium sp. X23 TaxID=3045146 RepID=UPI0024AD9A82|nr:bis(5'-nucleosyl)-tetraphosphatase (symmetrical) YqeK [Petroclostridium sp. X23]WHH58421.1 bis(5'-nucleosyl)-tetraphosphatase (symmetrical) YqeK [Petroclostridium sp. X23]